MNITKPKHLNLVKIAIGVVVLGTAFFLGTLTGGSGQPKHAGDTVADSEATIWTCVMHLHIQRDEPGLCPICSMELVPQGKSSSSEDNGTARLVLNESERRLAAIATTPVEHKYVEKTVGMVGKLDYDETKVKKISSWVNGRIERLYVDYTGIQVKKGDHLVELYSPDLVTAQEELLEAKRRVSSGSRDQSEFLRKSDERALESAREKLRLWGLTDAQVSRIESRNAAENNIIITSPQSGIVIHKALSDGEYVKTGTHIYTVADLRSLWVKLDAYESDLQWLHFGQDVEIETEAYPGDIFHGTIAFIEPTLDAKTRTVKVRVNVPNEEQRLKPGMFVRATVHAKLAKGGLVMDPRLAGKWIAPMHPEIVQDGPGICPICQMDLVTAESLGYVSADEDRFAPLVVPVTAVLRTGRRAVVYVELPDTQDPTYEGREVTLGARAGDYFLIRSGLEEGENVVVQGNFNIDSALQIKARPSMMSMRDDDTSVSSEALRVALTPVYDAYFSAQQALSHDDAETANSFLDTLYKNIESLDLTIATDDEQKQLGEIIATIADRASGDSIEVVRETFREASSAILTLENSFGHAGDATVYEASCPMAFGIGASWLQTSGQVENPFYGSEMFDCGSIKNTFLPTSSAAPLAMPAGHQH
ncbi:MAG: efflux RND transporter periplasmic adaptor subunit [Candidatus Hydrogenedentota bacterium]